MNHITDSLLVVPYRPLLMVPFLIPKGSPTDEEAFGVDIFRVSQAAQAQADRMDGHVSNSTDEDDDADYDDGAGKGDCDGKNVAASSSSGEEVEHVINFCAMEMSPVRSAEEASDHEHENSEGTEVGVEIL